MLLKFYKLDIFLYKKFGLITISVVSFEIRICESFGFDLLLQGFFDYSRYPEFLYEI